MDELSAFGSADETERRDGPRGDEVGLLIVTQGPLSLGVEASRVESVVPWQAPSALPQTSAWVLGVIQDRGRLVAVRRPERDEKQITRIVLCTTSRGLIGIPATETRSIGVVRLQTTLRYGVPMDSDQGAITLLDPEELARQMTDE